MSLGRQLLRNIVSSWISYGIRLSCGFFFVPYIAATLGGERYGLWTIIFQAINYFTLLDLGLERAVVKYVSKYVGQKDQRNISKTLSTATALYTGLGLLIGISAFAISQFFFGLFHINDPALLTDSRTAFLILGLFLMSRFLTNGYTQTIVGMQRTDVFNVLDVFEEVFRIGTLVYLLSQGYGLTALATGIFGVSLIRQLGVVIWMTWRHPEIRFRPGDIDKGRAKELFGFSTVSFGITLAWLVIFGSDAIILGLLATPTAAALFAPASQLMLYLRHIINAIGTPLAPAVSQLDSRAASDQVALTYRKGVKYVTYLSFFVSAGVVIFAHPFIQLWLPIQFEPTASVMAILAVGAAFFLPQILANAILFGLEQHRYLLIVLIFEAAIKLTLSLILVGQYGAVGLAIGTASAQVAMYSFVYPMLICRRLKIPAGPILVTSLRSALLALVVTVPLSLFIRMSSQPTNWLTIGMEIALVSAVVMLVGLVTLAEADDRARIARFLHLSPR
ncbi:MAG: oligosaccharide flippase family protein [Candidatus Zixiibacteriota bacterium]